MTHARLRRAAPGLAVVVTLLAGCAQQPRPLYSWGAFPRQQYDHLLHEGASAPEQLLALEAHADRARAANLPLPPGLRAHMGLLRLSMGEAGVARQLWLAEKAAFPESAPYMDSLLRRLDGPAATSPAPAASAVGANPA